MTTFQSIGRAALAASLALGAVAVAAQPGDCGPHVDVGPLLSNNGEPTAGAGWRGDAGRARGAGAGSASVTIRYVTLRPDSTAWLNGFTDLMVGDVTSGGVSAGIEREDPYIPSPSNNTDIERSNRIRVSRLVQTFAQWAAHGY